MLWALNLVNEIVDIISTIDVTLLAIRVIGIFGLVPDHSLIVVEVLIAVIVGAFDLAHDETEAGLSRGNFEKSSWCQRQQ